MRALLIDMDRNKFGNLPLMKLSAFHKAKGDEVFLDQASSWDKCYASCVFTVNSKQNTYPLDAEKGGTGFKSDAWLSPEVEHIMPDYKLYGHDLGYSMGFTSRGCIRRCPWCVVPEKEGWIKPWAEIYEFWQRKHSKIRLLDNNLLASPNWKDTMKTLLKEKLAVDFNQGLDIRLVTDEVAWYLKRVKKWGPLRFSFDDWSYHKAVGDSLAVLAKEGISLSRLYFYVLMGYTQDPEGDYARLELLRDMNCAIFPMIYIDGDGVVHPPALGPTPNNMRGDRNRLGKLMRLKGGLR